MRLRFHAKTSALISAVFSILLLAGSAAAASLTVMSILHSGAGSILQAIADASPGDTIDFGLANCPCTIFLTSTVLEINKDLTIDGPVTTQLVINGFGIADINPRRINWVIVPARHLSHTKFLESLEYKL